MDKGQGAGAPIVSAYRPCVRQSRRGAAGGRRPGGPRGRGGPGGHRRPQGAAGPPPRPGRRQWPPRAPRRAPASTRRGPAWRGFGGKRREGHRCQEPPRPGRRTRWGLSGAVHSDQWSSAWAPSSAHRPAMRPRPHHVSGSRVPANASDCKRKRDAHEATAVSEPNGQTKPAKSERPLPRPKGRQTHSARDKFTFPLTS